MRCWKKSNVFNLLDEKKVQGGGVDQMKIRGMEFKLE